MTWEDVIKEKPKFRMGGRITHSPEKAARFTESMINDLLKEIMELETVQELARNDNLTRVAHRAFADGLDRVLGYNEELRDILKERGE